MKNKLFLLTLFTTVLLWSCNLNSGKINVESVTTENGVISGIAGDNPEVMVFKGIPYAAPPVGNLRWKEPQPVINWEGVRKCDSFGPNAMQNKPVPRGVYVEEFLIPADGQISEDCLYLNVWTAAKNTDEKRPVIVYIHGGGFSEGSGSVPIYDGESMAAKGIVFVTINYRLGLFGFFAHPELTAESEHNASGNYAILDQIAALSWVKNNIAAFGGDPSNVTIAGQSAGSMSVNVLAATPLAKGLFAKMIAESGANVIAGAFGGVTDLLTAEQRGVELAKAFNAASIEELRMVSADSLQKKNTGMGSLIVDGYLLKKTIPQIFANKEETIVPLITGWNGDDALLSMPTTVKGYQDAVKQQYGADADSILKYYSATNDEEAAVAQKNLWRDSFFGVQNYAWACMQSDMNTAPVFVYYFERKVPEEGGAGQYGAFHSGEITYAYDNHSKFNRPWEQADYDLARLMSSYWVNFAKTGDPNGTELPEWPAFNKNSGMVMDFNVESKAVKQPYHGALEFLYKRATAK